ncbi:MAG: hypothetical protein ACQERD_01525 [Campylobacterota bacterium]
MKIEKLFSNLSYHKDFIFYLFEHRDKTVYLDECEKFISFEKLAILENFEIIEKIDEKIFLDNRVINFLENYLNIDENIEVSVIFEKLENLKHKIDIVIEYKQKQNSIIPQIRRELKKCDFILTQNLFKLRIHIDRVYKNIDKFSLKLKELKFYEKKLKELTTALKEFDKFLHLYHSRLSLFYNSELNNVLKTIKTNFIQINKSLIPLTQDVCEYINKAISKNIFIEKITKLKELKDNLTIKEIFDFVNINNLHLAFKFSNQNLIEFLLSNNELKTKDFEQLMQIYCRMILLHESEYKIEDKSLEYQQTIFKTVYYKVK